MTDPTPSAPPARKASPRRAWLAGAALAVAFVGGGVTLPVIAASAEGAAMHGMMHGGGHDQMHAMMMAHLTKMLDQVGASADQKSRIEAILHAGFGSMKDMHADMEQTHASLDTILSAPTVDRDALEQLRAGQIAKIDAASRTLVKAMGDAAEVLTPAQRAKFAILAMDRHPGG